jgi:hypothetical protein
MVELSYNSMALAAAGIESQAPLQFQQYDPFENP